MSGEIILSLLAAALLFDVWRWHVRLLRSLHRDRPIPRLHRYPSVSVIRPIKGLDCEAAENLKAALAMEYQGVSETIFVFDDEDDPSFRLLHDLLPDGRDDVRILFSGEPPAGRTGKLHAMITALKVARGEAIAFIDSDIRPTSGALQQLVDALHSDPRVGATFGQIILGSRPQTMGDVGYAVLYNGFYVPAAYVAAGERGFVLPFIMGQMMVLRREAIAAIGGLESADGQLVDDMYIGQLLNRVGYLNVLVPHQVPIVQHGLKLAEFRKLFVRWISFSRSGLPGTAFKWISWRRGLAYWLGLLFAAAAFASGFHVAAFLLATVPLSVAVSLNGLTHAVGGFKMAPRYLWVSFVTVLAAPLVYANIFFGRKVTWRGRTYDLDSNARLAAQPSRIPTTITADRRQVRMYVPRGKERRRAAA